MDFRLNYFFGDILYYSKPFYIFFLQINKCRQITACQNDLSDLLILNQVSRPYLFIPKVQNDC